MIFPFFIRVKFKQCVERMHPVFSQLYIHKKTMMENYGAEELGKSSAGGNDLASVLSKCPSSFAVLYLGNRYYSMSFQ